MIGAPKGRAVYRLDGVERPRRWRDVSILTRDEGLASPCRAPCRSNDGAIEASRGSDRHFSLSSCSRPYPREHHTVLRVRRTGEQLGGSEQGVQGRGSGDSEHHCVDFHPLSA